MGFKFCFIFLILAISVTAGSCSSFFGNVGPTGRYATVGDNIGEINDPIMDSEINRRQAMSKAYISYTALKKNTVPCNRKGQSYYNCSKMRKANPYRRGCSIITRCQRDTS